MAVSDSSRSQCSEIKQEPVDPLTMPSLAYDPPTLRCTKTKPNHTKTTPNDIPLRMLEPKKRRYSPSDLITAGQTKRQRYRSPSPAVTVSQGYLCVKEPLSPTLANAMLERPEDFLDPNEQSQLVVPYPTYAELDNVLDQKLLPNVSESAIIPSRGTPSPAIQSETPSYPYLRRFLAAHTDPFAGVAYENAIQLEAVDSFVDGFCSRMRDDASTTEDDSLRKEEAVILKSIIETSVYFARFVEQRNAFAQMKAIEKFRGLVEGLEALVEASMDTRNVD